MDSLLRSRRAVSHKTSLLSTREWTEADYLIAEVGVSQQIYYIYKKRTSGGKCSAILHDFICVPTRTKSFYTWIKDSPFEMVTRSRFVAWQLLAILIVQVIVELSGTKSHLKVQKVACSTFALRGFQNNSGSVSAPQTPTQKQTSRTKSYKGVKHISGFLVMTYCILSQIKNC